MPAYDLTARIRQRVISPRRSSAGGGVNSGERYQPCWGRLVRARRSRWPMSSPRPAGRRWCWPTTKLLRRSSAELREFPENAVEYFISYYDYYQPEAYVPVSDTYIAKTASINEEIDMLRHSATRSLFERRDVIVVADRCIYGLGILVNTSRLQWFEVGETSTSAAS